MFFYLVHKFTCFYIGESEYMKIGKHSAVRMESGDVVTDIRADAICTVDDYYYIQV